MRRLGYVWMVCGMVMAASAYGEAFRKLPVETYRDRMKGGWIGQIAGVCWGAPTEFKWNDAIIPEEKVPVWRPEMINDAFGQDDLYVEMTFLRTLEEYGLDVDIRQAGIDFANSEYALWCANAAGRKNLRRGIAPPDSSHPAFTPCPNDIDYQIEADYAGLISPGMPNAVIRLGNLFGRLMNYGDGVYGGQFMGGMYAEAFFTQDREAIVRAGLACIPAESQYAEMVRDLLQWHRDLPQDWQACWRKCIEKYRKNPAYQKCSNGGIDVKINGAMVLLGFLYGEGDLDRTITIAMRGGFDSDCNPSSAAGPLFTSIGFSNLPARFTEKLDLKRKFSFTAYSVPELMAVCEKLTRQILLKQGGRIEKDVDGRELFLIPVHAPRPDALALSWAPGPIANARFTPEEKAKLKFPIDGPHPSVFADPDPTRRVQKVLDHFYPGWTTGPNAPDMNPGYREDIGQEVGVFLTHPPKKGEPAVLTRKVKLTGDHPRLSFRVSNTTGDFQLIVKVDGETILSAEIAGQGDKNFRTFEISLAPWKGREVTLELLNQPTGWSYEAAQWSALKVE
ncbi:MAG: ADP-ribosylglycohydrolase family protein [Kiritimatiellae bacterium]|nr:ADP-ribosylglycohydrolase family protein [Kiritimatiellia bacterium]